MNAAEPVRLRFAKTGNAVYMSHLDLQRTMIRVLRRAQIPVWYTEGFHRHPYVTFASPLALGLEGLDESMDFRLKLPMETEEIVRRMSPAAPQGIRVISADSPQMKAGQIAAAEYRFRFEPGSVPDVEKILAEPHLLAEKKTKKGVKSLDIRPLMTDISWDSETLTLQMHLPLGETTVSPFLFLRAAGDPPCRVTRVRLLTADGQRFV